MFSPCPAPPSVLQEQEAFRASFRASERVARCRHRCRRARRRRRRRRRGCRCKSEVCWMGYCTAPVHYSSLCRYRRRAGVLAAGTGIRIRSTGRGVRHGRPPMRDISGNNKREKRHYRQAPRDLSQCSTSNQTALLPLTLAAWLCRRSRSPLRRQIHRPTDEVVRCHLTSSK